MSGPDETLVHRALIAHAARALEHGNNLPGRSREDYLEDFTAEDYRRHIAKAIGHLAQELAGVGADQESGLPHIAHAVARLNIAIAGAYTSAILLRDPGPPRPRKNKRLTQKR